MRLSEAILCPPTHPHPNNKNGHGRPKNYRDDFDPFWDKTGTRSTVSWRRAFQVTGGTTQGENHTSPSPLSFELPRRGNDVCTYITTRPGKSSRASLRASEVILCPPTHLRPLEASKKSFCYGRSRPAFNVVGRHPAAARASRS